MGDKISYPEKIGKCVKEERKKRNMNQIEFYRFLFPNDKSPDETIKAKMNDIENAKRKNINPDFLYELHQKCNLSIDYIFGYATEFPNYENKNACKYTGLSISAIELLHELKSAKDIVLPPLESTTSDEEFKSRCDIQVKKDEAEWILKILEVLLSQNTDEKSNSLPNFNILFDLYMIAVVRPEMLYGIKQGEIKEKDDFVQMINKSELLYVDSLTMKDSFGIGHKINLDEVHQQIWKNNLYKDIDNFISVLQDKYVDSNSFRNRIPELSAFDFSKVMFD